MTSLLMKTYFPTEVQFPDSEWITTHRQDIPSQDLRSGFRSSMGSS